MAASAIALDERLGAGESQKSPHAAGGMELGKAIDRSGRDYCPAGDRWAADR